MHVRLRPDWALPESAVSSESAYRLRRRDFLRLGLAGAAVLATRPLQGATYGFPSHLNPQYAGDGLTVTSEEWVTSYNNFYEFGYDKDDPKRFANRTWKTEPWTLELSGLIRNPGKHDVNDLLRKLGGIEQRIYRHRCVEAWSMVVPWDGVALAKLIAFADPKAEATHVRFTSFVDPEHAIGQQGRGSIDWPYVEGLRLDEAMNELSFLATGVFGKPIPNQNGAPIRLVVPWKYGFKGIKSITRIEFTDAEPRNTWKVLAPQEYGFYANVNPAVDHPRWSQASERIIGGSLLKGRQPTLPFNGYEKQVAALYRDLDLRRYY